MAFRGERFVLDLDDEEPAGSQDFAPPVFDLIGEVKERAPSDVNPAKAPAPPEPTSTSTGFPGPKKRTRPSAFKQQRGGKDVAATQIATPPRPSDNNGTTTKTEAQKFSIAQEEKMRIDEENKQRLAAMSPEEVEQEKAELMSEMPSSLLERFLRRANIDDDHEQQASAAFSVPDSYPEEPPKKSTKPAKSVAFDLPPEEPPKQSPQPAEAPAPPPQKQPSPPPPQAPTFSPSNDDLPPPHPPADLHPASEPPKGPIHFPTPPPNRQSPMPNLDPSSPSFLSDLQTHYFPNTPHDASTLSWFQDPSTDEPPEDENDGNGNDNDDPENPLPPQPKTSPYDPNSTSTSLPPSSIRFTLKGTILSPKTSLSLPTTLGLHHHGSEPQAAGYTIPELAILSRSTYPAQRCIAWQVLGRIIFRLGKGEFGERGGTLADGLWDVVEGEKVVNGMLREAGDSSWLKKEKKRSDAGDVEGEGEGETAADTNAGAGSVGRHASAKAWALEALWLWRLGGGGDRGLVKEGTLRSS